MIGPGNFPIEFGAEIADAGAEPGALGNAELGAEVETAAIGGGRRREGDINRLVEDLHRKTDGQARHYGAAHRDDKGIGPVFDGTGELANGGAAFDPIYGSVRPGDAETHVTAGVERERCAVLQAVL